MSDRVVEILREGRISLSSIPSGRQLPRTPPLTSVKTQLDFSNADSIHEGEELQQSAATDGSDQGDDNQNTMLAFNTFGIKPEPEDPSSLLRGMTGYQLTQADSDFMEKMRLEKLIKKLQGNLEELQRSLVTERTLLELALTSRTKAQAGLQTLPSCEDLTEWVKVALRMTSTEVTHLDVKSLLATVTRTDIQRATDEKMKALGRMEKTVAKKRKKEAQAKGELEQQVAREQLEIQGLMSRLSDLKSELGQQEEVSKALELQIKAPEIRRSGAVDQDQEERAKGLRQRVEAQESARGRKKPPGPGEVPPPGPGEAPLQGRKPPGPGEVPPPGPGGAPLLGRKPPGPGEAPPPGPGEAPLQGRKPPGPGEAPLQGRKRAAGEEEAQPPVLRRSKRIASRR
ncbi:formin-A-like [Cyclopterus lumpus]|uniref:formin-A-like n=1 Tax=Cyclopterus lumpus TaxID=8103 RepID=UPI001487437F|nr:formin-A-like [Cyclopterus lumpus]